MSGEACSRRSKSSKERSSTYRPRGRKHPDQKFIQVNTANILFICGGAFSTASKKIAQRLNTQAVGYGRIAAGAGRQQNLMQYILPQDLKSFGLIPELIAACRHATYLELLDRDALRRILTEPKNSIIKQYVELFKLDGIKLTFEPAVLDYIVVRRKRPSTNSARADCARSAAS